MSALVFTDHALRRTYSRSICDSAIQAALDFGRRYWNQGRMVYRLDRRSIEKASERGVKLHKHEGIHVVLTPDGVVATVYRNRKCKRLPR